MTLAERIDELFMQHCCRSQEMDDLQLLEAAAKAAGYPMGRHHTGGGILTANDWYWNPLDDDGDALRLAVKLGISIIHHAHSVAVSAPQDCSKQVCRDGFEEGKRLETTRRAIVKAAGMDAA